MSLHGMSGCYFVTNYVFYLSLFTAFIDCTGPHFTGGPFVNINDCYTFYKCSHGVAHLYVCPANLKYDDSIKTCNYPSNVVCPTPEPTTPTTPEPTTPPPLQSFKPIKTQHSLFFIYQQQFNGADILLYTCLENIGVGGLGLKQSCTVFSNVFNLCAIYVILCQNCSTMLVGLC